MTVANLIKLLQAVEPNEEVFVCVGGASDYDYREACAKSELAESECLNFLKVTDAEIFTEKKNNEEIIRVTLVTKQFNYDNIYDAAEEFDKLYQRKEE